jgi:hypothetical protein
MPNTIFCLSKNAGYVYLAECISGEMSGWHKYGMCKTQKPQRRSTQIGAHFNGKYRIISSFPSLHARGAEKVISGFADALAEDRFGEHLLLGEQQREAFENAFLTIRDAECIAIRASIKKRLK